MPLLTVVLLIVALVGGGLALFRATNSGRTQGSNDSTVIDLTEPEPATRALATVGAASTTGSATSASPRTGSREPETYLRLSGHQGRKLGTDQPLWRRGFSGVALLLTVLILGVLIAAGVGLLVALAGLIVERAV